MLKKNIVAIIPARANSKRIPGKNIKKFNGKPIIVNTIEKLKKSKIFDRIIVSTYSKKIASISKKYGLEVPFLRPSKLAQDDTIPMEVTLHALKQCPGFDIVVALQPTSPMRKVEDIDAKKTFMMMAQKVGLICAIEACYVIRWFF